MKPEDENLDGGRTVGANGDKSRAAMLYGLCC